VNDLMKEMRKNRPWPVIFPALSCKTYEKNENPDAG
jgi:hypothetical protein